MCQLIRTLEFLGGAERNDILVSPNFHFMSYQWISSVQFEFGLDGRTSFIFPLAGDPVVSSYIAKTTAKMIFKKGHSFNVQLSKGGAFDALPYLEKSDLYNTPDMSIRAGHEYLELLVERFLLINTEYRFTIAKFSIPPIFNIRIEGLAYADNGWTGNVGETEYLGNYSDGYGLGLRLFFDNPMFAYFSFSFGTNLEKKFRFVFTGTAGF